MSYDAPDIESDDEGDNWWKEHADEGEGNYNLGHGVKCNYCLDAMVPGLEKNFLKSPGGRLSNFHSAIINSKLNKKYGKLI